MTKLATGIAAILTYTHGATQVDIETIITEGLNNRSLDTRLTVVILTQQT
jgi:hypothetical protein